MSANGQEPSGDQRAERAAEGKPEVRWSARRKEEVVMRLLRGESLDALARECGQPAGQISRWRDEFLAAGREGLEASHRCQPSQATPSPSPSRPWESVPLTRTGPSTSAQSTSGGKGGTQPE